MSERNDYPAGAACWVDTLQPSPRAAADFYGSLFGWEFDEPGPMPDGMEGQYLIARTRGRLVAGIGQAPDTIPTALWSTYVRVDDIEESLTRITGAGGRVLMGPVRHGIDGDLAVVADVNGVAFSVWQAGERKGAQLVNEPGAWAMSALHTPGRDRAEAFYGTVFGWQLEAAPETPVALWRLPDYVGGEPHQPMPRDVVAVMTPTDETSTVPPHWAINFRVDDVEATVERAVALGGTLVLPPIDTPGYRSAVLADPQQGVIAISAPHHGV